MAGYTASRKSKQNIFELPYEVDAATWLCALFQGSYDSEQSSTSLQSGLYRRRSFKSQELRRLLDIITNHIDLSAVALTLYSNEVIELQTAQDLLQFTGGGREKSLKILQVFGELQRQEDRIPFFLKSLLSSGDSSPTNRELYEKLSDEMHFSESDVEDACSEIQRRRSWSSKKVMKSRSGSASSGIETAQGSTRTSTSSIMNLSSPPPSHTNDNKFISAGSSYNYVSSDNPGQFSADSLTSLQLQQQNVRLHQEVTRLSQQLELTFNMLAETQRNLETTQTQLKTVYQFGQSPIPSRKMSTQSQIVPSSENRIRKLSRSLDSIQHELIQIQLEHPMIAEVIEPVHTQLPKAMLNQKSPRLHARTTKSHK